MIKANELRIGNWVKRKDQYKQVFEIYKSSIRVLIDNSNMLVSMGIESFEPIPLTPEILGECGFEIGHDGYDVKNGFRLARLTQSEYACSNIMDTTIRPFNSLHQLQNLYFALTGEELKINL